MVAELKYCLSTGSLRAIERSIFDEQFRFPKAVEGQQRKKRRIYPCSISKLNRGVLPKAIRFQRMVAICPTLTTINALPLWEVINGDGLYDPEEFAARLSPEVKDLFFERSGGKRREVRNFDFDSDEYNELAIKPLERIGTLDAFTILAGITRMQAKYWGNFGLYSFFSAKAVLMRLVAFSPIYEMREQFVNYFRTFFVVPDSLPFDDPKVTFDLDEFEKAASELRRLLEAMGRLGLVGPKFADQLRLAFWFREDSHNIETIRAIEDIVRTVNCSHEHVLVHSPHPLYRLLKRIRHRSTLSGRPIELPRARQPPGPFRIANALEETSCTGRRFIAV